LNGRELQTPRSKGRKSDPHAARKKKKVMTVRRDKKCAFIPPDKESSKGVWGVGGGGVESVGRKMWEAFTKECGKSTDKSQKQETLKEKESSYGEKRLKKGKKELRLPVGNGIV